MRALPEQPKKKEGFSFSPELIASGPNGEHIVVDADHYVMLTNASVGTIYYTYKTNKYWSNENVEIDEELFKTKFLPYLRWKYDVLVDEILETERDGRRISLPSGRKLSKFPPTPENIKAKRDELIEASMKAGKQPDLKAIWIDTAPKRLLETEVFMASVDNTPFLQKLARKLYR